MEIDEYDFVFRQLQYLTISKIFYRFIHVFLNSRNNGHMNALFHNQYKQAHGASSLRPFLLYTGKRTDR